MRTRAQALLSRRRSCWPSASPRARTRRELSIPTATFSAIASSTSPSPETTRYSTRNRQKEGTKRRSLPKDGLGLADFFQGPETTGSALSPASLEGGAAWLDPMTGEEGERQEGQGGKEGSAIALSQEPRSYFLETYGCQMNVADSEVVTAILEQKGVGRNYRTPYSAAAAAAAAAATPQRKK